MVNKRATWILVGKRLEMIIEVEGAVGKCWAMQRYDFSFGSIEWGTTLTDVRFEVCDYPISLFETFAYVFIYEIRVLYLYFFYNIKF